MHRAASARNRRLSPAERRGAGLLETTSGPVPRLKTTARASGADRQERTGQPLQTLPPGGRRQPERRRRTPRVFAGRCRQCASRPRSHRANSPSIYRDETPLCSGQQQIGSDQAARRVVFFPMVFKSANHRYTRVQRGHLLAEVACGRPFMGRQVGAASREFLDSSAGSRRVTIGVGSCRRTSRLQDADS